MRHLDHTRLMRRLGSAPIAVFTGALLSLGCAAPASGPSTRGAPTLVSGRAQLEHQSLPALVLPRLHQQPIALGDFIRGKVAVIDLWASWCESCKQTTAQVERLAERYRGTDLLVIGINIGEDPETVVKFLTGHPALPTFLDPDFQFANALGASEIPQVYIVDRSGAVVHRARALDAEGLAMIRALLEEA